MNWEELRQSTLEQIVDWAEQQTWCQAMAQCVQDRDWHAEGDVWTHTKLVIEQLHALAGWSELSRDDQVVLTFTAIFHDAAKPLTSTIDPQTGRVTSPKHAIKGEHLARQVLRSLECDFATRERIAQLVRFHGRPVFLSERIEPSHEVIRLSWLLDNYLLYLFALADARGRTTTSTDRSIEDLEYWKLVAEENNCLRQPYEFPNDHARFLFLQKESNNVHYVPHETYACTTTMISGLPGSGKDTWLKSERPDLPTISLDDIRDDLGMGPTGNQGRVIQEAQDRARNFLRSKNSFAFNATNLIRQTRTKWIQLFKDYGARIEIVYLEPTLDSILRQNKQRTSTVPQDVIRRLADRLEPPVWSECHELIIP